MASQIPSNAITASPATPANVLNPQQNATEAFLALLLQRQVRCGFESGDLFMIFPANVDPQGRKFLIKGYLPLNLWPECEADATTPTPPGCIEQRPVEAWMQANAVDNRTIITRDLTDGPLRELFLCLESLNFVCSIKDSDIQIRPTLEPRRFVFVGYMSNGGYPEQPAEKSMLRVEVLAQDPNAWR
jgi:hypothetical protein